MKTVIDFITHIKILNQIEEARENDIHWQKMQDRIRRIKDKQDILPKVWMPEITNGIGYVTGGDINHGLLIEWIKPGELIPGEYLFSVIINENFNFEQSWKIFDIPENSPILARELTNILIDLKRKQEYNKFYNL